METNPIKQKRIIIDGIVLLVVIVIFEYVEYIVGSVLALFLFLLFLLNFLYEFQIFRWTKAINFRKIIKTINRDKIKKNNI